jgi:hypothetical protein
MPRFKTYHFELLQRIVSAGSLSIEHVDGRVLRPLRAADFVRVDVERVTATLAGKKALAAMEPPGARDGVSEAVVRTGKLSDRQEDLLRDILRRGSVEADQVDRRSARALNSRGLIHETDGRLTATPVGTAHFETQPASDGRRRRGRPVRKHPRAEAILKAVASLEQALPPDAEVLVGSIMCAADDVTAGFRGLARKLNTSRGREPES